MAVVRLTFDQGTLLVQGDLPASCTSYFMFDERVKLYRSYADQYRTVFANLHRELGEGLIDEARGYAEIDLAFRGWRPPFEHQQEAVQAWLQGGKRGLVVLPTGSGKTYVAEMAIQATGRSTLVVVPTLDLMHQWYARLLVAFQLPEIGLIGGGYYDLREITVTTYDSFYIHAERLGSRFGLLVFDECHHLPSPSYAQASRCYLAPFRLGLTATPEREGDGEDPYLALLGPLVYRREIKELAGEHLAQYEVRRILVELTPEERVRYEAARQTYLDFLRLNGIRMGDRRGWNQFIQLAARTLAGRRALAAYFEQREIAMTCAAKFDYLELLLTGHAEDRTLIFTNDNDTAYRISQHFLVPAITHQTRVKERLQILEGIRQGTYRAVVTSKVLNEGVDIPTANVGIVLSGSGSVREHVQRLGRILRRQRDKQARLYEIITKDTAESQVSERRRDHDAYR